MPPTGRSVLEAMRRAWDASPALIVLTLGPDHVVAYQSAASRRLFGPRPLGVPIDQSFPEISEHGRATLDHVLATGEAVEQRTPRLGVLGASGDEVLLTSVFAPVGEPGRPTEGVLLTAFDVTAEVLAARAAERESLLSQMSERMNAAADPAHALHQMTRMLVPAVADLAAVFVLSGRDADWGTTTPPRTGRPTAMTISPELVAAAGPPPESQPTSEPSRWDEALARGHAVLIDVEAGELAEQSNRAGLAWLHAAQARNLAVLPLAVAGQLAGIVLLLSAGERSPFRPEDLSFLELLAARAGAAVSHLRAYRQQRQIALDLQHALLPAAPTDLPALRVAARYVAGSTDVEIGGDWWDVCEVGPGITGVGLGDVSGRGVPAAVVMGQARAAMRAAALAGLSPAGVLTLLDRQLVDVFDQPMTGGGPLQPRFATAVYAIVDTQAHTLTVGNAGHPPLILRRPDGTVERVPAPAGPPVGLGLPDYDEVLLPFPAGTVLVGCTDGLLETRSSTVADGLDRLEEYVRQLNAVVDVDAVADDLLVRMANAEAVDDDIALVVLRHEPTAG